MDIRPATLDDTSDISQLFITNIDRWQRMTADGRVEDLPYSDLCIYERWLHGGAWMSIETGAIWLSHLLGGAGLAFVVEEEDIRGYAEAFISEEATPYKYHLHISKLIAKDDTSRDVLMKHLLSQAGGIGRLTVASTAYDQEKIGFYRRYSLNELMQIQRVNISAQGTNVGFYKVTKHDNADARQILDWQMPIGRTESARQHWEELWAQLWHGVPQITARKIHRLRFNVGGQDAFVVVQEQLYNPRGAEVFCWTSKALTSHLIAAIRDWSYKAGYRSLTMAVNNKVASMLGSESETTAHQNVVLACDI